MRLVLALVLVLAAGCERARPGIPPRNLLLVTCEALRVDRLSAYLAAKPTTSLPATELERREGRAMGLDDLAASGVRFEVCTTPSPRTVPALVSLFTGLSPASARVESDADRVDARTPTLAELFQEAGFKTAAFVTCASDFDLEASLGRGFGELAACADDTATLAAARASLLHDSGDGSRRFTWVHLAGAAPPFDRGATSADVEEALARRDFGTTLDDSTCRALLAAPESATEEHARDFANTYDRGLARTSLSLALFLQDVFDYTRPGADESECWARTVFAFTAPTGMLLGEDGRVGRADSVHEHMSRIPLVLRHPDSLTGERVSSEVVELADLLPTFVEWFDLPTPRRVEGRSLLARLDSYVERPFQSRPSVTRAGRNQVGVRDGRWHLVVTETGGRLDVRLFEPALDPAERMDVARRHPDVVRRLLPCAGPLGSTE